MKLRIDAADLTNTTTGALAVSLNSAEPVDAGAWVELKKAGTVVRSLLARSMAQVRWSCRSGSTFLGTPSPGDHAGAIVATLTTTGDNAEGKVVQLDQRVAVRMFVRVAGPVQPGLAVENFAAGYEGTLNPFGQGTGVITYTVRNTGNIRLAATQSLTVTGLLGTKAAVAPEDLPLILPGTSVDVSVRVEHVTPTVWETAAVIVTPRPPDAGTSDSTAPVVASAGFLAIPWTLLFLLFCCFGAMVVALRLQTEAWSPTPPAMAAIRRPRRISQTPSPSLQADQARVARLVP